ncbi:MAG: hypothetical protein H7X88_09890 [Gloeobacteraceae cyanobacterium ES-bin-316]|nr:hypothetical protein [Ferruginibacter sp.]
MVGYRVVYNYLANRADAKLELALDEKIYNDADLIIIKQASSLPYYSNSSTFQRLDGEVNMNGTIYKYVKCRIYGDSLEMLCVPHTAKMKIQNSKEAFFKLVNDFQKGGSKNGTKSEQKQSKIIVMEFEEFPNDDFSNDFAQLISHSFFYTPQAILQAFIKSAERPPDLSVCDSLS